MNTVFLTAGILAGDAHFVPPISAKVTPAIQVRP
jgi:hypothetical protein